MEDRAHEVACAVVSLLLCSWLLTVVPFTSHHPSKFTCLRDDADYATRLAAWEYDVMRATFWSLSVVTSIAIEASAASTVVVMAVALPVNIFPNKHIEDQLASAIHFAFDTLGRPVRSLLAVRLKTVIATSCHIASACLLRPCSKGRRLSPMEMVTQELDRWSIWWTARLKKRIVLLTTSTAHSMRGRETPVKDILHENYLPFVEIDRTGDGSGNAERYVAAATRGKPLKYPQVFVERVDGADIQCVGSMEEMQALEFAMGTPVPFLLANKLQSLETVFGEVPRARSLAASIQRVASKAKEPKELQHQISLYSTTQHFEFE